MLKAKALYFFYFAALASLLPFLVLYFESLGLSGRQIGVLNSLYPLMALVAAPVWGLLADATGRSKALLMLAATASLLVLLIPTTTNYVYLIVLSGLFSLFVAPLVPMLDHTVLGLLSGQKGRYGRVRLWGAVGWGLSAPVVGSVTDQAGLAWAFYSFGGLMLGLVMVVSSLKIPPVETKDRSRPAFSSFLTSSWLAFLLLAFLGGVSLNVTGNFLYLYMADLGASGRIVGASLTVSTLSEIPFMFFSRGLLKRFKARPLLLFALLIFVLRLVLYSFITVPWLLLPVQLLHGASFSLLWVAGVAYADSLAPASAGATSQGLFSAVVMGLGGVVGSLVGGVLYDALGPAGMFQVVAAAGFVGVMALGRKRAVKPSNEAAS